VVHRDIKPSNLLIGADGALKIADFGLASRPGIASAHGTPGYMAPEQMRGQADRRSDLFAAAVVLYQMLAGRRPFEGTPFQLMQQVLLEEPPPLPSQLTSFEPLLARGLAKNPARRYQHASEFSDAMLAIVHA
jgi:serine/threonine-protein kinase